MQSDFLAVSPTSDQFESTLNRLEWTESQRNSLNEYFYTRGQQHDVCVVSNGQFTVVSNEFTIMTFIHMQCTIFNPVSRKISS